MGESESCLSSLARVCQRMPKRKTLKPPAVGVKRNRVVNLFPKRYARIGAKQHQGSARFAAGPPSENSRRLPQGIWKNSRSLATAGST